MAQDGIDNWLDFGGDLYSFVDSGPVALNTKNNQKLPKTT